MEATRGEVKVTETYSQTLIKLARKDDRIVVIEADLMKASGSSPFQVEFPERHFQDGIAEQNLLSVAAGLASMGKIPFASTFANFASTRASDQATNSIAYNKFNVKICGSYAGLTTEKNGGTHMGVEDIAIFRCMPNMTVIVPGDCVELASAMEAAAAYSGPVFLRMARGPLTTIFSEDYRFVIGKAVVLTEGSDLSLITTGITTWEGIKACEILKSHELNVRHIHMPTIKPIDRKEILRAARETERIITAENHSKLGGLGSAVTEIVCDECPVPVIRLGINDRFGETGTLGYLMDIFGISAKHIVQTVEEVVKRNGRSVR